MKTEIICFILVIIIIIIYFIKEFMTIEYEVHKNQILRFCEKYEIGNLKEFIVLFNKVEWNLDDYYIKSLFDHKNNNEIHANIFKFNNIGFMVESYFEYIKIKKFIHNNITMRRSKK